MRQIRQSQGTSTTLRNDLNGVQDVAVRVALQEIHDFLHSHDLLRGVFRKVTYEAAAAGTHSVEHGLPFQPCDIWVSFTEGANNVTIDYESITDSSFSITTTGGGKIKLIAGNITDFDVTR